MPPSSALWLQKLKSSFLRWPTLCVTVCVTACVCVVKYQCARVTAAPLFGGGFHGNKFFGLDGQVQWSKGLNRKRQKREMGQESFKGRLYMCSTIRRCLITDLISQSAAVERERALGRDPPLFRLIEFSSSLKIERERGSAEWGFLSGRTFIGKIFRIWNSSRGTCRVFSFSCYFPTWTPLNFQRETL